MNVLFIAPGYPAEMPHYVRGLRAHGATVFGLGDQQPNELPPLAREHLADYARFPGLFADDSDLAPVKAWLGARAIDRVVCQWEPGVLLCGRLRDYLGVEGMGYEALLPYRDKQIMKDMIRDLNKMLSEKMAGGEPGFHAFMQKYGDLFGPNPPQTLEELIENMQRVDLCPLEKAKGIQQLMELDGLKVLYLFIYCGFGFLFLFVFVCFLLSCF